MTNERWFPVRHSLPNGSTLGRLMHAGTDWQIYQLDSKTSILIIRDNLARKWIELNFLSDAILGVFPFGKANYKTILSGFEKRLEPVRAGTPPTTKTDGLSFALSLRETRKIDAKVPLHDAIYLERYSRLLPTWTVSERDSDEEILGRWLTGGVSIPVTSFRRLANLLGWLDEKDVVDLVEAAGFVTPQNSNDARTKQQPSCPEVKPKDTKRSESRTDSSEKNKSLRHLRQFRLSGRPALEAFFNEHVIDIVENAERYKALGIEFPTAIVLHGPPGCGKTFATERLVEYLDWPIFRVDSNSVGSPYIHETSKKISGIFDKAIDAAPSMIIIDEMESYLSDRQIHQSTGLHHVEEVAEFLRRIPEANKHHVLIVGMTNRIEMIDSAILRRGRFDHVIKVEMPSAEEIRDLINSLLAKIPTEGEINIGDAVKLLSNRALSDTVFIVREAARLAARAGKSALDDDSLRKALAHLSPADSKKQLFGFIQE